MTTKEMLLASALVIMSSLPCITSAQPVSFYTLPNGTMVGTSQTFGNNTFVTDGKGNLTGVVTTVPQPQVQQPQVQPPIAPLPPLPSPLPPLPR